MKIVLISALTAAMPLIVMAKAPAPTKPVPLSLYAGRWYEVARTPNTQERGCKSATSEFSGLSKGAFNVLETCRKTNQVKIVRAGAKLMPGASNAKFKMSFLAGLIHQEYWILDTAPGGDWAIMATPGGNYVWVLSRSATLAGNVLSTVLARVAALGYPTGKLEYD